MTKLQAGQVWRTRGGELTTLREIDKETLRGSVGDWFYANGLEASADVRSIFGEAYEEDDDLMELVSE